MPVSISLTLLHLSGRAPLSDGLEPRADLGHVGTEVIEARQSGKRLEPEDALEERRRPVADRAEVVVAASLGDETALDEPGDDSVDVHATNPRDLGPRARAEIGDRRQRFERRLRQAALDGPLEE